MQKRNAVAVIAIIIMLSLLLSLGVGAVEYPDGSTVSFYNVNGTNKTLIAKFEDKDSGTLLKTMKAYGPAGEYYVEGFTMWGYDMVDSDFPWHLMVSAEVSSMSGPMDGGRSYYTQIGTKFTKLASPDTYNATVYFDPHTCVANVKHITVDEDGNESLYSSSTLNLTYDSSFSVSSKYVSNHTLNSEYRSSISKTFEWDLLDSMLNMPEDSYTARYHSPTWEDIETEYYNEREIDIVFKYTLNNYLIEYNANGGSNPPDDQTKWYGIDLELSDDEPTRDGYTFLGWHTSPSATYASYEPGDSYTANRANCFFAVWEAIEQEEPTVETYTVSYDANGGSNAPSSQSKTQGEDLVLSSKKPTRSGYTFLGWTIYDWSTTVYYEPGDTYSDDEDVTLYALWEENTSSGGSGSTLESYIIEYDANGGSGAPSDQTKYEGVDITLSSREPSQSGYTFLGWSKYSWSSTVYYMPGDIYSKDADITLYAVWEEIVAEEPETEETGEYEFSISDISMLSEIEINNTLSISARTDNWNKESGYTDIPIQLLYDGTVVDTQYVDFDAYGIEYVYFDIDVGEDIGSHTVALRINWSDRYDETDSTNNKVSGAVEVISKAHELFVEGITPNASYRENTTVVSSFNVYNDSDTDALTDAEYAVSFIAYYYSGGSKTILSSQTWRDFVVPANGSNLVYFKWDVPDGLKGVTVYCEAEVDGNEYEKDKSDNSDYFAVEVIGTPQSQPDNTYYENTPSGFTAVDAPSEANETASWKQWVYESGNLVLKRYSTTISCDISFEPHDSVTTAEYKNGAWYIGSGYGVTLTAELDTETTAPTSAYTDVQVAYVTFPEFKYSTADGYFAVLEESGGDFSFAENQYSNTNAPVHFIPVWYPDGEYTVSLTLSDCWTPYGMVKSVINAKININGTMYDDFYVGG